MEKTIRVECTGAATVPLEKIIPLQGDLKTISPEKLRKLKTSIIDYGISSPTQIWVDPEGNCFTLDGHQRLLAYRSLQKDGWIIPEIPVVYVEAKDTEEAREKVLIATSSYGEFSATGVEKFIKSLKNRDRLKNNINLLNIDLNRIYAVLNSQTDPDDIPLIESKPTISKQGDLWICGKHKIVCGDSGEKATIDRLLGGIKPKFLITDPPYGIQYQPEWRKALDGSDNRKNGIVLNDNQCVFENTFKYIDADAAYVFHAAVKSLEVLDSFINHLEYRLYSQLVWVKQSPVISRSHWHWQHEPIFYFVKTGRVADWTSTDHKAKTVLNFPNHNPFGGTYTKNDFNHLSSDMETRTIHSTQKPVALLQEIIKRHGSDGDVVVDPFLGSGSTLIACETLNRKCLGVELSEQYCDLILSRFTAYSGSDPIRLSDGKKFSELKKEFEYMEE